MAVYENFSQMIGSTPLLKLNGISEHFKLKANIFAKLEYFNPAGSIKDRVAYAMIKDGVEKGIINGETTLIEPTSGNTGIGLAAVAASLNLKVVLTMPETMSVERRKFLQMYGARLVLTEGKKGMKGAIEKAEQLLAEIPNSVSLKQFENAANPKAHYMGTGREIWNDLGGKVDYIVAGVGTGGTITGAGEYLKEKNPRIKVVAVEPETSPVLSAGTSGAHKIQGIGAGFVPKVLNCNVYDEVIVSSDENAYKTSNLLCKCEGVLTGISSGAALWAAIQVALREEARGKNIVVICPDSGDRYLSTPLFD